MLSKKILFITHQSYLSGAPRSLLYYLDWLKKKQPEYKLYVLSLNSDNPENNAFRDISDVYYDFTYLTQLPSYTWKNRIIRLLTSKNILSEKQKVIHSILSEKFDLIYANTVISLPISQQIKNSSPDTKILLHVHELTTAIQQILPDFKERTKFVDYFIAASDLVKEHLIESFNCNEKIIQRVYECSDIKLSNIPIEIPNKDSKKVIMVGGAYWAKGDDIFILVAKEVVSRNPAIHFYWLGSQSLERKTVNEGDMQKLELNANVHFLPHTTSPHDLVKMMDVFALTSRSDSFPLAAIEAGLLGVPIVCFEKASGIQEIITQGGGEVVPYLDIQKMADAIIRLVTSDELREQKSLEVKELFQCCRPEVISHEIDQIVTQILEGNA